MPKRLDIFSATALISKQRAIAFGLFNDAKSSKKSKYWSLFNAIKDNIVSDHASAQAYLQYTNDRSYKKLVRRYTEKLLDIIILADSRLNRTDGKKDDYHRLLRTYAVARILHYHQDKNNAVILYQEVHNTALKNEFLDLALFSAVELKKHFAFIDPHIKKYKMYTKGVQEAMTQLRRTVEIDGYYDDISHKSIINTASRRQEFNKETLELTEKLMNNIDPNELFYNQNRIYEIAAFAYNANGDYEKSIDISLQSAQYTQERMGVTTALIMAYKDILTAYLKMKNYDEAQVYLHKIYEHSKSVAHNYFRYRSLEFLLHAATKDYDSLFHLTQSILAKKELHNYKIHVEEWQIRQAYVNILIESGKISTKIETEHKWKFSLNKFINQVEFYSKDKRGTNISIHVIQLMHFLIRKDYGKVLDRLDALNQYTYRYLKNDETLRSNCFIKMLLRLPEAEYHPIRTQRYVTKYLKKLRDNPFEISMKEMAVEIIPYEDLWEIIIEILGANLAKK